MTKSRKSLGTDLSALLGVANDDAQFDTEELINIPIKFLTPGRYQPRRKLDPSKIDELAKSIEQHGVMQPLVLRKIDEDLFEIVAGERRWRACQQIGLEKVPALLKDLTDEQTLAMSLIENIQREDLNVVEEGRALIRLQEEFNLTQQQVAQVVSKPRSTVTNLIRLLALEGEVLSYLEDGEIELGHAKCLLGLTGLKQVAACKKIIETNLTVRQTELLVKTFKGDFSKIQTSKNKNPIDADILNLQNELSEKIGSPVIIQHKGNGSGKLVIQYFNNDQLQGIIDKL
tara:strand:+ start:43 stop:903 length:861 start_codon:yes stop_codon:yes gene_type:complete